MSALADGVLIYVGQVREVRGDVPALDALRIDEAHKDCLFADFAVSVVEGVCPNRSPRMIGIGSAPVLCADTTAGAFTQAF
jgi:hypothetical protein